MKLSARGRKILTRLEGVVLHPYQDAAGLWTIGVGHLIKPGEDFGSGITMEQAMTLLAQDVAWAEVAVNNLVQVDLNQNQFDTLVSFVFNVGQGAFERSTLLRVLNDGDYDAVPHELRKWNRAGGRVVRGLISRRETEVNLWLEFMEAIVPGPGPLPLTVEIPTASEPTLPETPLPQLIIKPWWQKLIDIIVGILR